MSDDWKFEQECRESMRAIHRLGRCADYLDFDVSRWEGPAFADPNFEIGVWEAVQVEKKPRRRHLAERKPHEPIDYDKIDFNSHLCPKIENIKPFVERPRQRKYQYNYYDNVDCFCYVCLIRLDLSDIFPSHMIIVTEKFKPSRLFQVENAAESMFNILRNKMVRHAIPQPQGLAHLRCNYRVVLNFFEYHCRRETIDVGIVLNDYLATKNVESNLRIEKRLHSVFKAFVYASAAKVMYKHLIAKMDPSLLNDKQLLYVKRFRQYDPLRFLQITKNSTSNIAKNFLRLY